MSTSIDIRGLFNIVNANVASEGGKLRLNLPKTAIDSQPIQDLFAQYLSDQTLVLELSARPVLDLVLNQVTISAAKGVSFPFTGADVNAAFTIVGGVPQMQVGATLSSDFGALTALFPALKGTDFDGIGFNDPSVMTLASWNVAPVIPQGLSLNGAMLLAGSLAPIAILFNDVKMPIEGQSITLSQQVPNLHWIGNITGEIPVGNFGVLKMTFEVTAKNDSSDPKKASVALAVVSSISYESAGQPKELKIEVQGPFDGRELLFRGDVGQGFDVGLAVLSKLADGANVGGLIPSQMPLPPGFYFHDWILTLDTTTGSIRTLTVGAGIELNWEIVPNLLRFDSLDLTVLLSNTDPPPLTAIVAGQITIGEPSAPGVVALSATYPGFVFNGQLLPGTSIQLKSLVASYLGAEAASILPVEAITALNFWVNPSTVEFSASATLTTNWALEIAGVVFNLQSVTVSAARTAGKMQGAVGAMLQVLPPSEDPNDNFTLAIGAAYDGTTGNWMFATRLVQGTINVGKLIAHYAPPFSGFDIQNLKVTALAFEVTAGTDSKYRVAAAVEWKVDPGGTAGILSAASASLDITYTKGAPTPYTGFVEGRVTFFGIDIRAKVSLAGPATAYELWFWGAHATFKQGKLQFQLPDKSLGEIITLMLNAARPGQNLTLPPPFDVLNSIRLSDFLFEYDFNTSVAGVSYPAPGKKLGLDFGFLRIDRLGLFYDASGGQAASKVQIKIVEGWFAGQGITPEKPKVFDATDPSSMASQVPGKGEKLLRLKFLALGQHVSPQTPIPLGTTIFTAVNDLQNAFRKTPPRLLPGGAPVSPISGTKLKFDDGANWIVATNMTILDTVSIRALFLDPELYGVSIGVQGPKGGKLNGLSFDILYRRVNENVGVYQLELKVPDIMRQLEFGQVTITLPIIGLEIFTNGDFRVDFGFPKNDDFSRSFGVQVLPFTGSGGFYFGVLSGASSTRVPQTTLGTFSPVLELGVGLKVGLGKEINKGILKAGLSLTVQAIIEGTIAWYSPYASGSNDKAFFYAITGKCAIVGNLYGAIDFAIISAKLDITVKIGVTLSVQIYRPVEIGFFASVRVTLTVSINLGIFSIDIDLKFEASIQQSFTIGSPQKAPWDAALAAPSRALLRATPLDRDQCADTPKLLWQKLKRDQPVEDWTVDLLFVPQLTSASVIREDGSAEAPKGQGVAMLFAKTSSATADADDPAAPFIRLAKGILVWAINAYLNRETPTPDGVPLSQVLGATITAEELQKTYCGILAIPTGQLEPFLPAELHDFVAALYVLNIARAAKTPSPTLVSAVPMVPEISLTRPDGTIIPFAEHNKTDAQTLGDIKTYFQQLAERSGRNQVAASEEKLSLATFLWMDFFAMIAKEAVQSAYDALQNATVTVGESDTLAGIVERHPHFGLSVAEIAAANLTRLVRHGAELKVPGTANTVAQVRGNGTSLLHLAREHRCDAVDFAIVNADVPGLFAPGKLLLPNADGTTVAELIALMESQGRFGNLSGLAARVLLAGLRPPYPNGDKKPLQALYAISGQQFDVSTITDQSKVKISIPDELWIKFAAGGTSLEYQFSATEADIATKQFTGKALQTPYVKPPAPAPLYRIQPKRFTLANPIAWSTSAIWPLPANLQQILQGEHAIRPKVKLVEERQDALHRPPIRFREGDGIAHRWATRIDVAVRRIPSAVDPTQPLPYTYDFRGTGEQQGLLLQNLLTWWNDSGKPDIVDSIDILYTPDPAQAPPPPPGFVSANAAFVLLQTNLSSVSNPPAAASALRLAAPVKGLVGMTAIEFLRLVWECSIVRSGGYDFYYLDVDSKKGLPDYLFEQQGDVTISLLVTYKIADDVLDSFLNSVVIDQAIDPASMLFVETVPQTVAAADLPAGASLAELARRHHLTVAELAERNARVPLHGKRALKLHGERTIATTFDDTFASLAEQHGVSVAALAVANRDACHLFREAPAIEDQLVERIISVAQGNVAWTAERVPPQVTSVALDGAIPDESGEAGLQQLFNLASYAVVDTAAFRSSNWGLPAGPAKSDEPPADPNASRAARFEADLSWPFNAVLPIAKFSKAPTADPVGPPADANPYRGVGSDALVDIEWLDMFGNRILTGSGAPNTLTLPVRYYDDLLAPGEWPGFGADYYIQAGTAGAIELVSSLTFDTSPYETTPESGPTPKELATATVTKYALACYQVAQPDVQVAINSTTDVTVVADDPAARQALLTFLRSVYDYLAAIAGGTTPVKPEAQEIKRTLAADNPSQLYELLVSLTIQRTKYIDPQLDDPAFPAVRTVTAAVKPLYTEQPEPNGEVVPLAPMTLRDFAEKIELAFQGSGTTITKVAGGTPETNSDGSRAQRELWLVRFDPAKGIWYSIDKAAPRFYTLPPVATSPMSQQKVDIYQYKSGQFIGDGPFATKPFSNVDLEVLARQVFAAIDQFLSPDYVIPAWNALNAGGTAPRPNAVDQVLSAKKQLAAKVSAGTIPVYDGDVPPADARQAAVDTLEQQLLIRLSDAYTIDTVVQYGVASTSQFTDPDLSPRLFGKPLFDAAASKDASSYSLTTTRFSLRDKAVAAKTYATFSFSTRDKGAASVVELPLRLDLNHVERPQPVIDALQPYRPSRWLAFVIALEENATLRANGDLGKPAIPIPLRAYPTPPSMVEQHGRSKELVDPGDLAEAKKWLYEFTYEYPAAAAQDVVYARTEYTTGGAELAADAAVPLTRLGALVQFASVYADVQSDLNRLLTGADDTVVVNAIRSFAWLVTRVASAWNVVTASDRVGATTAAVEELRISQKSTTYGGVTDRLLVLVERLRGTHELPVVEIPGAVATKVEPPPGPDSAGYVYTQAGAPLLFDAARTLPRRMLSYPELNALVEQNVLAATWVTRNEELAGKKANPLLVYQTPEVRFFNLLTPILQPDAVIDVRRYAGGAADLPTILKRYLEAFFTGAPAGAVNTIRLEAQYEYELAPGLPVRVPILLTGPATIATAADRDALASEMAAYIGEWFNRTGIRRSGKITFDQSLWAGSTVAQLPTLRLADVYLDWTISGLRMVAVTTSTAC